MSLKIRTKEVLNNFCYFSISWLHSKKSVRASHKQKHGTNRRGNIIFPQEIRYEVEEPIHLPSSAAVPCRQVSGLSPLFTTSKMLFNFLQNETHIKLIACFCHKYCYAQTYRSFTDSNKRQFTQNQRFSFPFLPPY